MGELGKFGARKRTRTSTPLRELEPESSASASSAIRALFAMCEAGSRQASHTTRQINFARRGTLCQRAAVCELYELSGGHYV
jgi:hypothetical protein